MVEQVRYSEIRFAVLLEAAQTYAQTSRKSYEAQQNKKDYSDDELDAIADAVFDARDVLLSVVDSIAAEQKTEETHQP